MGAPRIDQKMMWCWGADHRLRYKEELYDYCDRLYDKRKPRFIITRNGAVGKSVRADVQTDGILHRLPEEKKDQVISRMSALLGQMTMWGWVITRKPYSAYVGHAGLTITTDSLKHARDAMQMVFDILKEEGICTEEDYL